MTAPRSGRWKFPVGICPTPTLRDPGPPGASVSAGCCARNSARFTGRIIDGVEIFEPYRNPVWSYAYSRVLMGNIRQFLPDLGQYDLILCNDVLEHFPRDEASQLIALLLQKGRVLLATTPNRDFPQGAWGGNEAETHHSLLDRSDFTGLVAEVVTGLTTCYVCTARRELVYPLLLAADRCPQVAAGTPDRLLTRVRRKWRQWRLTRE
jgi:SAM-dependent methyltransferase